MITVDIKDPQQWTDTYGVEGAAEIRSDVKSHLGNAAQQIAPFGTGEVDAEVSWS
ncbi:hypothetical protein [Streptomyces sp. OK228]|uniref:hypothetical protein n=1 Tax=Streptomyces sp. OK228 TaxID=1882786 RepID=UPI0015CF5009|nr:hypothetical protein [Streptomyces sp. OK228]